VPERKNDHGETKTTLHLQKYGERVSWGCRGRKNTTVAGRLCFQALTIEFVTGLVDRSVSGLHSREAVREMHCMRYMFWGKKVLAEA